MSGMCGLKVEDNIRCVLNEDSKFKHRLVSNLYNVICVVDRFVMRVNSVLDMPLPERPHECVH